MAYFPVFIDLSGKRCLIVGGGNVAARKAAVLLEYGADVHVVALKVGDRMRRMTGKWEEREFAGTDMDGAFLVIAATDNEDLNHRVSRMALARGIMTDSATRQSDCSFIFPAVVKRGEMTVGITTSGSGPAVSAQLRKRIEDLLPEQMEERLELLKELRITLRETVDSREERGRIMGKAAEMALTREQFTRQELNRLWPESTGEAEFGQSD